MAAQVIREKYPCIWRLMAANIIMVKDSDLRCFVSILFSSKKTMTLKYISYCCRYSLEPESENARLVKQAAQMHPYGGLLMAARVI